MNKRIILAPRYNLRIEGLGDTHVLALECMSGGFKGSISAEYLCLYYKPYERIKLVEGDFKCDDCGRHGACDWHVEEIGCRE